jgi:hypothetical protein
MSSAGWLYSGGIDSYLMRSMPNPKTVLKLSQNFTQNIQSCGNLVLLQKATSLEIWRLEEKASTNYEKSPIKLASITAKRNIISSSLSNNWIAYSTCKGLTVLHRSEEKLVKVNLLCEPLNGTIEQIRFNGESFLSVSVGLQLYVFSLDVNGILLESKPAFKRHIHEHLFSSDLLIVILNDNTVKLITTATWEEVDAFQVSGLPAAVKVNPFKQDELWFALATQVVTMYNLKKRQFENIILPSFDKNNAIRGIAFTGHSVLVHDDNLIFNLDPGTGNKRSEVDKYMHILNLASVSERELFVVELQPIDIFNKLPPAFGKKLFAT